MYQPLKLTLGLIFILLSPACFSQEKRIPYREKEFQFSFFPGVNTEGFETAKYTYKFSFSLTSSLAAGTKHFAFAPISNIGTRSGSGIQLAGLANITGSNSYLHLTNYERKSLEKEGQTPNFHGIQLAGLINLTRGHSRGISLAGMFNTTMQDASGFYLGGLGNAAQENLVGAQIGGLYNIAHRSVYGFQVSTFVNITRSLTGLQLAAINRTKLVYGKANNTSSQVYGMQVGLINTSKGMNGFQIGLINKAGRMRGTQIGLVNLFTPGPYDGAKPLNGMPIGLINIGSQDSHARIYTSDLFLASMEYTTGNCDNCTWTESQMPIGDLFYKTNQNALFFGWNSDNYASDVKWGIGYGFHRMYYIKHSMSPHDPENRRFFFSPSLRFMHLNKGKRYTGDLSLLSQLQLDAGYRIGAFYLFAGGSVNGYLNRGEGLAIATELVSGTSRKINYQVWPGYMVGIQY